MSEEKMLDLSLLSDEEFSAAFDDLYTRYADDVIRVCYFYLADRGKAEDVCHDAFMSLYLNRPALIPGKEKGWLLKVAMNRCRDIWRSSWARRMVLGSPVFELIPGPDTLGKRLENAAILTAVHNLPADYREVILLYYYQGLGIREIAEVLNLPEGTISSRLARGRSRLEKVLKDEEGGEWA